MLGCVTSRGKITKAMISDSSYELKPKCFQWKARRKGKKEGKKERKDFRLCRKGTIPCVSTIRRKRKNKPQNKIRLCYSDSVTREFTIGIIFKSIISYNSSNKK